MNCKVCHKKAMTVYAKGKVRKLFIGYYCPRCNRFIQNPDAPNVEVYR